MSNTTPITSSNLSLPEREAFEVLPADFQGEVDTLIGGAGIDVFFLRRNGDEVPPLTPAVSVFGTNLADTLEGTNNPDVIIGRGENDTISSFQQDDFITGQTGDDLLFAGQGNDTLIGNTGNDTQFGDVGLDIVYAGTERDILYGNQGDDTLHGDGANDVLFGGQGNDSLIGGTGNDLLIGDRGDDTLFGFSESEVGYSLITDFNANEDKLVLPGSPDFYSLNVPPAGFPDGIAVYRLALDGSQQLFAIVQGDISTNFNSGQYIFA